MNYYQKIIIALTLVIVAITMGIVSVCFPAPYTFIFIMECCMIVFSELLVGTSFFIITRKSDSTLAYSMGLCWISLLYFAFTMLMTIPALFGIEQKYFILLHFIGFSLTSILYGVFSLGEHNITEQTARDTSRLSAQKEFYLQMHRIVEDGYRFLRENNNLLERSRKMVDKFRFAATSTEEMSIIEQDIHSTLQGLKTAVSNGDAEDYRKKMDTIETLYRSREEVAKFSKQGM